MLSVLPSFNTKNFYFVTLRGTSTPPIEGSSTRISFHMGQVILSKSARAVAVLLSIILLLTLTTTWLPNRFSSQNFLPLNAQNCTNNHHVDEAVNWSRFAYVQYATNVDYLCNSVMLFEILHRLDSKADRLLMYPSDFYIEEDTSTQSFNGRLLKRARDKYNVKLKAIQAESFTKLLAFNQTQYDRVLHLDSDSTILQPMDELFLLPPAPMAMPRAYWLGFDKRVLSSQIMLLQPSEFEFKRVFQGIEKAKSDDYDMEIVNDLYQDSALILPHRPYDLLTGEFRNTESSTHVRYLGNEEEQWDPDAAFKEAKFLHFSDWPFPKPWIEAGNWFREESKPNCINTTTLEKDCRAQTLWLGFYTDFNRRRKDVCNQNEISEQKRDLSGQVASDPIYRPIFP
ncbi:N-acetylglucosaminyltransferase [Pseudocyphellaria aurata]|nr:N-acetylglucosaminyltransferase [Pseudocyphellaria aurata]